MALNMAGLGFTFGAKDLGVGRATKKLGKGLDFLKDTFTQAKEASRRMGARVVADFNAMTDPFVALDDRQKKLVAGIDKTFFALHRGARRTKEVVSEAGDAMAKGLGKLGKGAITKFGAAIKALPQGVTRAFDAVVAGAKAVMAKLDPTPVKEFFKAFADKTLDQAKNKFDALTGAQKNLTTSAEAEAQQRAVEARRTAANMGYTGKALDQVIGQASSMAKALDIGAEEATKAIYNFAWAEDQFKALGIKTATDLAKFTGSFQVDQEKFTETLAIMGKELKITGQELPALAGSFIAYGKESGNVGAALMDIEESIKLVRSQASLLGRELDPKTMASYVKQQATITGILYSATQDLSGAKALSQAFTQQSVESQKTLRDMFAGTADDLTDFQKELSVLGIDVGKSMQMMEQGPEGVMMSLAQMAQQAKGSEVSWARFTQFVGGRLGKALGEEQTDQFINALRNMDAASIEASVSAAKASADLGKMTKEAWRSGKTLATVFDEAEEALVTRFRAIGRSAAVDFVKDSQQAFKEFGDSMAAIAKEGGPMGQVVTKLSEIHQIGALALVPREMRGFAAVLGSVTDNLAPAVTALGAMGFRFSMLLSPALILGSLIGLLGFEFGALFLKTRDAGAAFELLSEKLTDLGTRAWDFAKRIGNAVLDGLVGITAKLESFASGMDWSKFFTDMFASFGSGAKGSFSQIESGLADLWGVLQSVLSGQSPAAKTRLGKIAGSLLSAVSAIFAGLGSALMKVDWSGMMGRVFTALGSALGQLNQVFAKVPWDKLFGALFGVLTKALSLLAGDTVASFLGTIARLLVERVGILVDAALVLIQKTVEFLSTVNWSAILGKLARTLATLLGSALQGAVPLLSKVFKVIPGLLTQVLSFAMTLLKNLPAQVAGVLMTLGKEVKALLPGLLKAAGSLVGQLLVWVFKEGLPFLVKSLPAMVEGLWDLLVGIGSLVLDLLDGLWEGVKELFSALWAEVAPELKPITEWFSETWAWIKEGGAKAWAYLRDTGGSAWKGLKSFWAEATGFFMALWEGVKTLTLGLFQGIALFAKLSYDGVVAVWEGVSGFFGGIFDAVRGLAADMAQSVVASLVNIWVSYIQPVWQGFLDFATNLFTGIKEIGSTFVGEFIGIFTGAVDRVRELFDSIFGKVQELFGHSVNTVVGADMEKTVGVVQTAAGQIEHDLEVSLFDAITRALTNSFQTAFLKIANVTKEFVKNEVDALKTIADKLKEALQSALSAVVASFDQAFADLDARAARTLGALKQVKADIAAVAAERVQQENNLDTERKKLAELRNAAVGDSEKLLLAVNLPEWYVLRYEPLFNAQSVAMREAIDAQTAKLAAAIAENNAKAAQRARVQNVDRGGSPYLSIPENK